MLRGLPERVLVAMRCLYRAARVPALLSLMALTVACGPAGAFGDDGGGGGNGPAAFQFQVPADGSTVDQVITLSAGGPPLASASFSVDGSRWRLSLTSMEVRPVLSR